MYRYCISMVELFSKEEEIALDTHTIFYGTKSVGV